MTEIRADALRYPVIFFWDDPAPFDFEIWRETTSLGARGKGVLVDRDGVCFRVVRAEVVGLHFLPRVERGLPTYRGETLLCDGEPFLTSVEKVREKIVWLVSARGHFERPQGLPCAVDSATGVWELLEVMRGFDRFNVGFF